MKDLYKKTVARWQAADIKTIEQLDLKLDSFKVLFAYHSGKIENPQINYHDTREIFNNSKISSFTGDVRTVFEQQNQKFCYEFLKSKIINKDPISVQLIKKIHHILCHGTYDERRYSQLGERPGEYKKHDYVIGINEVGASPENVDAETDALIKEVNEAGEKDIFKTACYLHAAFENIHPFADGNGRVGRTLMNYYLMINNHPPVVIKEEDRKEYYNALEAFDVREDLKPLEEFLLKSCIKTWEREI